MFDSTKPGITSMFDQCGGGFWFAPEVHRINIVDYIVI